MKLHTNDNHLIERTKLLEGILCQSITFTNAKGKQWGDGSLAAPSSAMSHYHHEGTVLIPSGFDTAFFLVPAKSYYESPIQTGTQITIMGAGTIAQKFCDILNDEFENSYGPQFFKTNQDRNCTYVKDGVSVDLGESNEAIVSIKSHLSIRYTFHIAYTDYDIPHSDKFEIHYTISGVENQYPLKPYTITDCICRCLELSKPLLKGESPQYRLQGVTYSLENGVLIRSIEPGSQADKYDKIIAPNFSMTQCTLREQLKIIGGYIHAEPRLGYNPGVTIKTYEPNVICFQEYGQDTETTLSEKGYVYRGISQSINDYCTNVTTDVSNLVNTINYADGVITDPALNGIRTLRTESVNIMLSESNAEVYTQFPIYSVSKVECGLINPLSIGEEATYLVPLTDITPYVFEAHEYNSILSSYEGTYPYSKSYGIYYTQGQKNIKGLFYKPETASAYPYLNNWAIQNILESATGKDVSLTTLYPYLCFRITYTPVYNSKFSHSKSHMQNGNYDYTTIYSQGENLLETTYYGENIKGVAERLGNVEQVRTYILPDVTKIPKTGQKMGDYVISVVTYDERHTHIKCTIALTKSFNRISQYVGVNSHKRISEVSEREAYQRNILLKEYVVIGKKQSDTAKLIRNKSRLASAIVGDDITGFKKPKPPITCVVCAGAPKKYFKDGNNVDYYNAVSLPVVSSAFGNVMVFSWNYKDNYSAGLQLGAMQVIGNMSNWIQDVPYCDYYGRLYWYDFVLCASMPIKNQIEYANGSPASSGAFKYPDSNDYITSEPILGLEAPIRTSQYGVNNYPVLIRKDSREALNLNYALEFITNRKELIIGSAIASKCTLVGTDTNRTVKIYFWGDSVTIGQFPRSINDIDSEPISVMDLGQDNIKIDEEGSTYIELILPLTADDYVPTWCIAYNSTETTETYSNEDGETDVVTTKAGGEIVLACNKTPYVEGMERIYISVSNTNLKGV